MQTGREGSRDRLPKISANILYIMYLSICQVQLNEDEKSKNGESTFIDVKQTRRINGIGAIKRWAQVLFQHKKY
jgi:hypothetical protein